MPAEDDRAIIDLYFARDETAIRLSQDRYGDYCMSVALYILRDRMDAEECVNDTWLRAWRAIPPTRPVSLRAFLAKITRNLSLDRGTGITPPSGRGSLPRPWTSCMRPPVCRMKR